MYSTVPYSTVLYCTLAYPSALTFTVIPCSGFWRENTVIWGHFSLSLKRVVAFPSRSHRVATQFFVLTEHRPIYFLPRPSRPSSIFTHHPSSISHLPSPLSPSTASSIATNTPYHKQEPSDTMVSSTLGKRTRTSTRVPSPALKLSASKRVKISHHPDIFADENDHPLATKAAATQWHDEEPVDVDESTPAKHGAAGRRLAFSPPDIKTPSAAGRNSRDPSPLRRRELTCDR